MELIFWDFTHNFTFYEICTFVILIECIVILLCKCVDRDNSSILVISFVLNEWVMCNNNRLARLWVRNKKMAYFDNNTRYLVYFETLYILYMVESNFADCWIFCTVVRSLLHANKNDLQKFFYLSRLSIFWLQKKNEIFFQMESCLFPDDNTMKIVKFYKILSTM